MKKKTIAILFGGCSSEYDVSLQSAYSVISNLDPNRYDLILLGITRTGEWLRYYGNAANIPNDTWHTEKSACVSAIISPSREAHGIIEFYDDKIKITKIDMAFPLLHGKNGEDGTVQGLIELAGIPLIGCNTVSSAVCMDKNLSHKLVQAADIRTPAAIIISKFIDTETLLLETQYLKYPLFVKPLKAGSSIGITKIYTKEDLTSAVNIAFTHDNKVIIEENIDGFEVGCAVLGNDDLLIGEIDEIELTQGFFDYTEKYTLKSSKIHIPARIDAQTANRIKAVATLIYKTLECTGFARVDMFVTPSGEIVFNEVNTIPGFTSHSRYPNMMKGIGLSFKDLLDKIIDVGGTHDEKNNITPKRHS